MRLWLMPTHRPDLAWYRDLDFGTALKQERMREREDGQTWGAFESSFFGPEFQWVESMSGSYEERMLNMQFTRVMVPVPPQDGPDTKRGGLLTN